MLELAGIKSGEASPATTPISGPDLASLQKKIADLEARNEQLQAELGEEKKRNAPQALDDLAKDLQAKIRKRDETIARLEAEGKQMHKGGNLSVSPEPTGFHQKVEDLEAKIQALQAELGESKKKNAPQALDDLAKDLQVKLRKRDETIARLEAEGKQMREDLVKLKAKPIPEKMKELEVEIKKKDAIIDKLENDLKEAARPKLPSQERWWY
jgi:hypothetical protein